MCSSDLGRLLGEASPGPGERIVVAPIDITALRHERATRRGHHMLAHLRTEAYPVYTSPQYPPAPRTPAHAAALSFERNVELIDAAKQNAGFASDGRRTPASAFRLKPEATPAPPEPGRVASGFSRKETP